MNAAGKRLVGLVLGALFLTLAGCGSIFSIDQNERGFVRRFGTVMQADHTKPLMPGIHFKLPFIDSADTLQVSLKTLHVPAFDVLTVDNQKVTLDLNFNYTVPDNQVYHIIYEVGKANDADIDNQVLPVARDRAGRVFAGQNMVTVNANREAVQRDLEARVTQSVQDLFGLAAHSLQIAGIKPSDSFMASIDAATRAKNEAIRAENQLRTVQFEAQQVAAQAKGQADAAVNQATGQAAATKALADANRYKAEQEGLGEKAKNAAQIEPFGSVDKYIAYLGAQAMLKFPTHVPNTYVTGSSASMPLVVPLPSAAQ